MPAKKQPAKKTEAAAPEASRWPVFAIGITVAVAAVWGYSVIWGGVRLAGVEVTDAKIQQKLAEKIDEYKKQTLTFSNKGSQYQVSVASIVATYDIPASVGAAKADHNLLHKLFGHQAPLRVAYEPNSWAATILGWSSSVDTPVSNASVSVSGAAPTLVSARTGTRLDFGVTSQRLSEALSLLETGPTPLATYSQAPLVSDAQLQAAWPKVKAWLSGPVTLTDPTSGETQQLSEAQIAKLVSVRTSTDDGELLSASSDPVQLPLRYVLTSLDSLPQPQGAVASLDSTALQAVAAEYAPQYYKTPVDAQLDFANNALNVTAPSQNGQQLDEPTFISRLKTALDSGNRTVELPVQIVRPDVREDNLASLGITQLIGRGTSNWGISPPNRIHNILTGLARFKSVLVKPDQVFSFNKVLGPVDASTGYLPELSILVDKTVPEFGGGLCQVSSTAWRGSLNAGLPTVSRTNHAYPVSYYFPIGTDATIYLPYPDMQWRNTTGHYVLIQAYNKGNNVFFDYYGSEPAGQVVNFSRNADMSGPVDDVVKLPNYIFNVQPDGREDTIFYRTVTVDGKVTLADHFFTRYQPASKFPHIAQ